MVEGLAQRVAAGRAAPGAGKAQTSFASQPLVEASVLQTIGTTFSNLAEFPEAEKALRAALDLRLKAAGEKSAEAAESLGALSQMYAFWRKFDEAEKRAREALEIVARDPRREERGGGRPDVRPFQRALRSRKARRGESARREDPPDRAGRGADRTPGSAKAETDALLILIQVATTEEDFKSLTALARERLGLAEAAARGPAPGGRPGPERLRPHRDVHERLRRRRARLRRGHRDGHRAPRGGSPGGRGGAREPGERLLPERPAGQDREEPRVVLAMRRKALGDDSEPVARTLANMATVYKRAGNDEAAERTYREALERLTRKLGPDHPDVGMTLLGFGDLLMKKGNFPEAEAALLARWRSGQGVRGEPRHGAAHDQGARHPLHRLEEARAGGGVRGETEARRREAPGRRAAVATHARHTVPCDAPWGIECIAVSDLFVGWWSRSQSRRLHPRGGRMTSRLLVVVTTLFLAGCLPKGEPLVVPAYRVAAAPCAGQFVAGVGRVDMTPPPGYPTGGHGPSGALGRGHWMRLYARAFDFEDPACRRLVLVSLESFAVPKVLFEEVASRIAIHGNSRDELILAATHTHQGPGNYMAAETYNAFGSSYSGFSKPLLDDLACAIARAIQKARKDALDSKGEHVTLDSSRESCRFPS